MCEQNRKTNQTTHRYGVKTYFIKNRTHPGTTDCQKCAQYEMSRYCRYIRHISENITCPEIEKHRDDESDQAILTVFQGKAFNKFQSPGKKQTNSGKKYGEQNHADHSKVPGVEIHAFKYCGMQVNQKGENIRTDQ
jgi:hypothetical protein